MKFNSEYGKFEKTMEALLKVSHKDLQEKLEEEKKRKKIKKSSASRVVNGQA